MVVTARESTIGGFEHPLGAGAVVASLILLTACQGAGDGSVDGGPPLSIEERPPSVVDTAAETPQSMPLAPGQSESGELATGAIDTYSLTLESDTFVRIAVEQFGVDVVAKLFDPHGGLLIKFDQLTETARAEQVVWVAGTAGVYRLEITAWNATATGAYEVRFAEHRPATERDHKSHAAELLFADGDALRRQSDPTQQRQGEAKLRQAVDLWRDIDDRSRQADGLYRLARSQSRRDRRLAIATFERMLGLLDPATDAWQMAETLYRKGILHYDEGEVRRAAEHFRQALPLRHRAGFLYGEARTRNMLGLTSKMLGDIPQALDHYRLALEQFRELAEPEQEARALHNLGKSYLATGMLPEAQDSLDQALDIRERLADPGDIASTLTAIGQVQFERKEYQQALATQLRALALSHEARARNFEALALSDTALTHQRLGNFEEARERFEQALEIYRDLGDRNNQATALRNIGNVLGTLGQDAQAAEHYRQALTLFEATEHRQGRILTLHSMGLAQRRRGELKLARDYLETALAEIERLRVKPRSHTLRYSYFATKQSYYEDYVDLLMALHHQRPDVGFDAEALAASERARARSQLDALTESGADLKRGTAPELLELEVALESDIASLELHREQSSEDGVSQRALATIERRLRSLFLEHDRVQAEIRIASPQYAALTQPQPLTAAEIQRRVVDPDTILLEFDLGEESSYLWAVTPTAVRSFVLPAREEIEAAAKRAYALLSSSHLTTSRVQAELALSKLSRLVLQPVAELLDEKRLLIVADGALQYIPFAALPMPPMNTEDSVPGPGGKTASPLGEHYEIVSMPSASTLAVLRRQIAARRSPRDTIAVFADPVFEREDPRLREGSSDMASSAVRGALTPEPRQYARLIYSRQEAEDILALVPAESAFAATGFEASRDVVMTGRLVDFRFLHFATHGVLNTARPELSRLVLSQLDREGRKLDGFVFAHELYNLELAADLVVLSACETALGAEVRGEGLLGLTQGFMYAGAASVLVSLWNVDDQATAELMAHFYRGLLVEKLRPAAALRAAQVAIHQQKRWRAPYFWAGFVLQGEWR